MHLAYTEIEGNLLHIYIWLTEYVDYGVVKITPRLATLAKAVLTQFSYEDTWQLANIRVEEHDYNAYAQQTSLYHFIYCTHVENLEDKINGD